MTAQYFRNDEFIKSKELGDKHDYRQFSEVSSNSVEVESSIPSFAKKFLLKNHKEIITQRAF